MCPCSAGSVGVLRGGDLDLFIRSDVSVLRLALVLSDETLLLDEPDSSAGGWSMSCVVVLMTSWVCASHVTGDSVALGAPDKSATISSPSRASMSVLNVLSAYSCSICPRVITIIPSPCGCAFNPALKSTTLKHSYWP